MLRAVSQGAGAAPSGPTVFFMATIGGNPAFSSGPAFTDIVCPTVAHNIGGGAYSTVTGIYTVPTSGLYACSGAARIQDGNQANVGLGIDVVGLTDTTTFYWNTSFNFVIGNPARTSFFFPATQKHFNSGDQIRLFIYVDNGSGGSENFENAYLSLLLTLAD